MERKLEDLNYDLEIDRIIKEIDREKAKKVLLQFPDGLKIYSNLIADELKKKTKAEIFVWLGSCFGACDLPNVNNFDLLIQFGHTKFK